MAEGENNTSKQEAVESSKQIPKVDDPFQQERENIDKLIYQPDADPVSKKVYFRDRNVDEEAFNSAEPLPDQLFREVQVSSTGDKAWERSEDEIKFNLGIDKNELQVRGLHGMRRTIEELVRPGSTGTTEMGEMISPKEKAMYAAKDAMDHSHDVEVSPDEELSAQLSVKAKSTAEGLFSGIVKKIEASQHGEGKPLRLSEEEIEDLAAVLASIAYPKTILKHPVAQAHLEKLQSVMPNQGELIDEAVKKQEKNLKWELNRAEERRAYEAEKEEKAILKELEEVEKQVLELGGKVDGLTTDNAKLHDFDKTLTTLQQQLKGIPEKVGVFKKANPDYAAKQQEIASTTKKIQSSARNIIEACNKVTSAVDERQKELDESGLQQRVYKTSRKDLYKKLNDIAIKLKTWPVTIKEVLIFAQDRDVATTK